MPTIRKDERAALKEAFKPVIKAMVKEAIQIAIKSAYHTVVAAILLDGLKRIGILPNKAKTGKEQG
jgi:hypothetical protein